MKREFTDQMGRSIEVPFPPSRIVSLVPSQTELLYDLGLSDEVVGQTIFCIHPEEMHRVKPRIGGTKKLQTERIEALKPDLIIGNKEENQKEQVEALMSRYPVWMSDVHNVDDALQMIADIGAMVGRSEAASALVSRLRQGFDRLGRRQLPAVPQTALYLIWRRPWMAAGRDTFINDMLSRAGFTNAITATDSRYPELTDADLAALNPAHVLLSSEPYPFRKDHADEIRQICPGATVRIVDGELFSWYGSRLGKSVDYLATLMDPATDPASGIL